MRWYRKRRGGALGNYHRSVRALFVLLAIAAPIAAQQNLVDSGNDHFYNLEYDEAATAFEKAIALRPDDPELHNHLAQALVFREMFRNGALESELVSGANSFLRRPKLNTPPEVEERFLAEIAKSMSLTEARLRANPKDTAALYTQGIAYGLRANYYWLVKKAWRDALSDATAARRAHNRVTEIDPANVDARLVQGLHDYVVGSLPMGYRMLGFLVGIRGDKPKGIRTVQEVAAKGNRNRLEAAILLCALYRRENTPNFAIPLLQDLIRRFPRNYILHLELSQMYSMTGDKQHALEAVDRLAELKTRAARGFADIPWEKIYFQRGIIQFWYNDLDQSLVNLKNVTAAPDVDLNAGAQARLRIGQIHDMRNRRAEAVESYKQAVAFAPQSDAAAEARRCLSSPYRRK